MRTGRVTAGVVLWLAAAATGVLVGTTAVGAIGTDLFGDGQEPLSAAEVDALLTSRAATPAPTSPPTSTPAPTTTTPRQVETDTVGGTVISRCTPGGLVEVLTATPAQGYRLDSPGPAPDDHPTVEFKAEHQEVEVRLRCAGGVPIPEVRTDD